MKNNATSGSMNRKSFLVTEVMPAHQNIEKNIMRVGDSNLKSVRRNVLNSSFLNSKFYIKSFRGAKTRDMKPYINSISTEQNKRPTMQLSILEGMP